MFMGHYGPAVWDTQRGKGTPLVTLWQGFLAVQAIDIVWAFLVIAGIEGQVIREGVPIFHIPYSHSLLGSAFIALCAGGMFRVLKPSGGNRGFWVIAGLVMSHWVLDLIVHRPDLSLYPGGDLLLGFAVWDYPWAAYGLEMGLVFAGFWFWKRVTIPKSMRYSIALWALFLFMAMLQAAFILVPGLQLQAGTFDPAAGPQGALLGLSALMTFALLAGVIGWIESGRPSRYGANPA